MISIKDAETIAKQAFPNNEIKAINDMKNYFVFELVAKEHAMDMVHMINKQTGEIAPYDPRLLKGKTK